MTRPQPRRPPLDQCRPPLSQRCVQLLRHMLLFPEQLSAQCCLQTAASKAHAGTDQTTRPSTATAETSLHIVASLLMALSLVAPCAYFYPEMGSLSNSIGTSFVLRGSKFKLATKGLGMWAPPRSGRLLTESARMFASGRLIRIVAAADVIGPSQAAPRDLAGRALAAIRRRLAAT